MSFPVEVLLALLAVFIMAIQIREDRKWVHLLSRLPRVRANIRARIREELCLDCRVGEPHACPFMSEAEYAGLLALEYSGG